MIDVCPHPHPPTSHLSNQRTNLWVRIRTKRRGQQPALCSLLWEATIREPSINLKWVFLQHTRSASILKLDLPALRAQRNNFCYLSHPVYSIFVIAAWTDEDTCYDKGTVLKNSVKQCPQFSCLMIQTQEGADLGWTWIMITVLYNQALSSLAAFDRDSWASLLSPWKRSFPGGSWGLWLKLRFSLYVSSIYDLYGSVLRLMSWWTQGIQRIYMRKLNRCAHY